MDYKNLPKIELHCHLDGSLRVNTVIELVKKQGIELPSYDYEEVKNMLVVPENCKCLDEYLMRFDIPLKIMQDKESLKRIAFELMEDAAKENVKYIEIRFAPWLHIRQGLTLEEVIESVIDGIKHGESKFDIKGNLIIAYLRHHDVVNIDKVIDAGAKFLGKGVVDFDLAGSEPEGFASKYVTALERARNLGYRITIHAGETGFASNVKESIELLKAERIGHGVYIYKDKDVYDLVKNSKVTLEVCPKSNVDTKAFKKYSDHPIYQYHKDGIKVNLSTDNRTVSNITLTDECENVIDTFSMTYQEYKEIYLNSIDAAFCSEDTKKKLREYI